MILSPFAAFLPFNLVYNFAASVLRAVGDTKRPLYFLAISGLANVLFNRVFVIVFDLSVAGVAIATITSQYISAFFIVIRLLKIEGGCRLHLKKLRIHSEELKRILLKALPRVVP